MAAVSAPARVSVPPPVLGDVAALLQGSRPRPVFRGLGRAVLGVWIVAAVGPLLAPEAAAGFESVALLATLGASVFVLTQGSALRRESAALDDLEGLLARRRTDEAAPQLHGLMSRPMRTGENRLRAMLLLGGVLSRLGRTDDALAVYGELIDAEGLAGPGGAMVKLARTNEMLRADHLYDADRAINELRRLLDRGGVAAEVRHFDVDLPQKADPAALAGLRLVELYRDVKTGHWAEALAAFDEHLPRMKAGLGHRVAGAYALAAVALHGTGRREEAAARYADATALAPLRELVRRYPELWPLTETYAATKAPPVPSPGRSGRGDRSG